MQIIKAIPADYDILTAITFKSKAYWNYTEEQLLAWKEDLTITNEYIEQNTVFKLIEQNQIIGYYSILKISAYEPEFD